MNTKVLIASWVAAVLLGSAPARADVTIVDSTGWWRWRVSWRKPVVLGDSGEVLPVQRVPFTNRPDIELVRIPPPPESWSETTFDDSAWPRTTTKKFAGGYFQVGAICMRTKFRLTDAAGVKSLKLAIRYRGGVRVFLNGKEVARKHLPEGDITLDTSAAAYPDKAWVDASGKLLPHVNTIARQIKAGDKTLAANLAARDRELTVDLPASTLVKGVNVLAIANNRSEYHPLAARWFRQSIIHSSWKPLGVRDVKLTAAGKVAFVDAPGGPHVYNLDLHDRFDKGYRADPAEPLRPIRIVAARNGSFSGWVGVSAPEPIKGLAASVSDLTGPDGAKIPVSAVDVRYVLLSDGTTRYDASRRTMTFDLLSAKPAPDVKLGPKAPPIPGGPRPVWVRVNVPPGAKPGDYTGELRITAARVMQHLVAPIKLHVTAFALPDPLKFRTHASIYQSPISLATQYKVEMWSDAHWKLMDKSFALLARAGNDYVTVPVVDRTQFGNDEGMVRWIRKPDGTFDYDFATLDKFLALARKHLGNVRFVGLQVWHAGGWSDRGVNQVNTVTVVDPKTGRREHMQVPKFDSPEARTFWSAAIKAIQKRIASAGIDEKNACLGILSDSTAPKSVFEMFSQAAPGLGWMRGCHGHTNAPAPYSVGPGSKVILHEHCYGMVIPNPDKKILSFWSYDGPATAYFRSDFDYTPPRGYRATAERALYQGKRGVGRIALDYWVFPRTGGKHGLTDVYNRWPESTCSQRRPTLMKLAGAGSEGPASTVRYELLLEGLAEAEAMIIVAEALNTRADKLGPELTERCRRLLRERIDTARILNGYYGPAAWDHTGWQDASKRVFEAAAQVAAKLK